MTARGELLFEIGCEEIPAGMIAKAANELKQILETHLISNRLTSAGSVETFGAPRRLVAMVRGVAMRHDDIVQEIIGPPKSVAFDNVGSPTRAAQSFADKQGIELEKIEIVMTPKGEYLAIKKVIVGRAAKDSSLGEFYLKRYASYRFRARCTGRARVICDSSVRFAGSSPY